MKANDHANKKMPPLTPEERRVLLEKGTEAPFSGKYWNTETPGTYICRGCGAPLYRSDDKFDAGCGWPSFDEEIQQAVARRPDADGQRTEIVCAHCGGHLGHVFEGEWLTARNMRHCVNSASLSFEPKGEEHQIEPLGHTKTSCAEAPKTELATAVFAGGCFWGMEDAFRQTPGVVDAVSGYTGGQIANPDYRQVCAGDTGHAEAVKVTFAPSVVSYEALARLFFEIHDPAQLDRQGPDVGSQYRSAIFYANQHQKCVAEKLAEELRFIGYAVVTRIEPLQEFYLAEDYHQRFAEHHRHTVCPITRVPKFKSV